MRSVTALSADVLRAIRVATAFSGASAVLFAITVVAGAYAAGSIAPALDVRGWSLLAGTAMATITAAVLLLAARDRILLRTGLWFGHAYAHHHMMCGAADGATLEALADREPAFRQINASFTGGTIARRMDALWLPVIWAALAAIHPAHAIAAITFYLAVTGVGRLLSRDRVTYGHAAPVALGALVRTAQPSPANIDAWEVANRAAVAGAYSDGKRKATRHLILGTLTVSGMGAIALTTAWLVQHGGVTLAAAAAATLLHIRHASVALAYASQSTARRRVRQAAQSLAQSLTEARTAAVAAAHPAAQHSTPRRPFAPGPALDVRHAA